jgi:hypothetical protein
MIINNYVALCDKRGRIASGIAAEPLQGSSAVARDSIEAPGDPGKLRINP